MLCCAFAVRYSSSPVPVTVGLIGVVERESPARLISPGISRVLESSASPKRSVRVRAGSGHAVNGCEQVAPTIGIWVAACFPGGTVSGAEQIRSLVKEAADAARTNYSVEPTTDSAGGCPEGYGVSGIGRVGLRGHGAGALRVVSSEPDE